ncbi:DEHA2B02354p [Debaryomyces hansenii CBS767]|uniref:DEHA2B02354p n=1 Tax=Debaryomyces hansenii (strain ATCC 36239 / CBS 767 / BCRC 21394 / JCM 1990 / NBRC 0083 / IGC 2968) TaxID=284592 RepID=Q6BXJ9_DEBHA|nr:DEHA2B02354p [Debaryomyces hansenii CBS767]CAG85058.2 DEHA2B02354p [Debaryomyces hansenii CBS767]|eukprot:XP_457070.2 DEHA2B02354p [Debaryomyces hansenii CBS767]
MREYGSGAPEDDDYGTPFLVYMILIRCSWSNCHLGSIRLSMVASGSFEFHS